MTAVVSKHRLSEDTTASRLEVALHVLTSAGPRTLTRLAVRWRCVIDVGAESALPALPAKAWGGGLGLGLTGPNREPSFGLPRPARFLLRGPARVIDGDQFQFFSFRFKITFIISCSCFSMVCWYYSIFLLGYPWFITGGLQLSFLSIW